MNPFNPFNDDHDLLRQSFREFLQHEVMPNVEQWESEKHCDREMFRKMGQNGYLGVTFPEQYGGSGLDLWAAVVIAEELAYANIGGLRAKTTLSCPSFVRR